MHCSFDNLKATATSMYQTVYTWIASKTAQMYDQQSVFKHYTQIVDHNVFWPVPQQIPQ